MKSQIVCDRRAPMQGNARFAFEVILLVAGIAASDSGQARAASQTFEWHGQFSSSTGGFRGSIKNWIEGFWDIKVETELRAEAPPVPGYESFVDRFYSIKSVSFHIRFHYAAFPADSSSHPVIEDYLVELNSSDFDLTYPPNIGGLPYPPDTMFSGSFVDENYNPINDAYMCQIFLRRHGQRTITTPKGATLILGPRLALCSPSFPIPIPIVASQFMLLISICLIINTRFRRTCVSSGDRVICGKPQICLPTLLWIDCH